MKRIVSVASALMLVSFALASCASMKSIDKIEGVVDLDWELKTGPSGTSVPLSAIKPGERYFVQAKYLLEKKGGKTQWKNLSNTEGVTLSSDNPSFSPSMPWLQTPADPFVVFSGQKTVITVSFRGHTGKDVSKPVALALPSTLPSFRGKDGSSGDAASGGTGGTSGFSFGNNYNGSDGGNGGDGQNVDLEIARYDTKGTSLEASGPLLLVRDTISGRVWLLASGTSLLTVDAAGGSGGKGGKGADRELEEDSDEKTVKGGNGGDGGAGGRGGFVHIVLPKESAIGKSLNVSVAGGKGGPGGAKGKGETNDDVDNFIDFLGAVVGVTDGREGAEGSDGANGRYVTDSRELKEMFTGMASPLFDRNRLIP